MNLHPQYRIRFFLFPGVFALVSACAPQNGIQEPDEEPLEEVESGRSPVEINAGGEVPKESESNEDLRSVYARKQAYDQGSKEFEKWKKANPEAVHALPNQEPTPQPTPQPTSQPEVVSEEPTDRNEFPFRVNANGRVPHVEDYIRQNAAFPDSLVVRTWWPVQPHERGGYQVRVRYTLKSAGNLGTSYEDMIFFMHGNGRIHQRAPVK